jgi:hypothetical protein
MNSIVIESINYSSRLVQSLSSKVFIHLPLINHSYCFHPYILYGFHFIHLHVSFIHLQFLFSHSFVFNSSILSSSFFIYLIFLHQSHISSIIFIHLSFSTIKLSVEISFSSTFHPYFFVHERLSFIFIYHSPMGAHYSCAHQIAFPDGWCSSTGWVQEHCHPSH